MFKVFDKIQLVGAGLTESTDEIKETLALTKDVTGKLNTLSDEARDI